MTQNDTVTRPATPPSTDASGPAAAAIVNELLAIMRKQTGKDGADWSAQTTIEEAGIDSFDFVEMVFAVEEKFSVDLNFNANTVEGLKTVGDVADLVLKRLAAAGK